jgi:dihydrofolate reductase
MPGALAPDVGHWAIMTDEYRVYTYPVIIGGGKRFFPALERKIDLELVETRTFSRGMTLLKYRVK